MSERDPKRQRVVDDDDADFYEAVLTSPSTTLKRRAVWGEEGEDVRKRAYVPSPRAGSRHKRGGVHDAETTSVPKRVRPANEPDWLLLLLHVHLSGWKPKVRDTSDAFIARMRQLTLNKDAQVVAHLAVKDQKKLFFMSAMRDRAVFASLPEVWASEEKGTSDLKYEAEELYNELRGRELSRLNRYVCAVLTSLNWGAREVVRSFSNPVGFVHPLDSPSPDDKIRRILGDQARLVCAAFGCTPAFLESVVAECELAVKLDRMQLQDD